MLTLTQARKILGEFARTISDEDLEKEIELSDMIAELALAAYKSSKKP